MSDASAPTAAAAAVVDPPVPAPAVLAPTATAPSSGGRYDEAAIRKAVADRALLKNGTGLVPMKAEFVRTRTERDASATGSAADARLRGQNKGRDREFTPVVGTGGRPTFEGEVNFLFGPSLGKIKVAMKGPVWQPKRDRNEEDAKKAAAAAAAVAPPQPSAEPSAAEPPSRVDDVPPQEDDTAAPVEATADPAPEVPQQQSSASVAKGDRPLVASVTVRRSDEPPEVRRKRLFHNKLVLAPLTTVGNLPFRRICKQFGADVTIGEMAMAYNLNHTQQSEWSLLRRHKSEDIFGIQIACPRGVDAAKLAALLEASDFEYDYLDINCGCPVDLIIRHGCGCGLWERKGRMRDVVQNFAQHQGKPVTIKCRIGPDENDPQLHKQIDEYESWGADAVTIHGRSRKQRYTKLANWSYVEECAKLTRLPVIGNGDLFTLENYAERREVAPSVSSWMFARGALIKPWIFKEIKDGVAWDISSSERFDMLQEFANCGLAHWGSDEKGVATTRRYLLEWQSFLCRYVPIGLLEQQPQFMNDRPPYYVGRNDLETLMASDQVSDWIALSEMILGPAGPNFKFTPKHKSNSYQSSADPVDAAVEGQG